MLTENLQKAYGASKCREWAWANAKGNTKHIQKNTLINGTPKYNFTRINTY